MPTPRLLALLPLVAACVTTAELAPDPTAAAQFERLKGLEGEWVVTSEGSTATAGSLVSYRVTSAGSALLETLFAGTPHEMVTLYHLDRGRLVLTHYCALANQPRMVAEPSIDAGRIRFRFDGGTNVDPAVGQHMHEAEFTFVDDAHFRANWTLFAEGKPAEHAEFSLVRSWR
jgi:hypothetical protein